MGGQITERVTPPWVVSAKERGRCGVYASRTVDLLELTELAQQAEEAGFDSFWVADHPLAHGRDCWTTLAALAQATRRIRLGSLTTSVLYRHPVHLARIVADVDRLSGGRVVLGLGIGDAEQEFAQLGVPHLSVRERQRALEEALRIVCALWAGEQVTLGGRHFHTEGAFLKPGPVERPHVPLLISGGGEKVTLRQVAQYADASNFGPAGSTGGAWAAEDVRRKYDVLAGHCTAVGRRAESVLHTYII